ncbi:hypothetical protein Q5H92_00120 [Hymenobacter sp. M29]|uniref:DUF4375 domain-containing protein n=1 Tax=Hymenobacter mellowenesis TaxID=3063995 RepID=A0ABT9A5D6_9BACT|nr:hypothetical protein [Hymenobacter sp. M29]MDO7844743.1 hypothetical protein [Hymenobacter sp. M29]
MSASTPLPAGLSEPIPFYVTPYYNSEGPEINVGPLSQALLSATPATIGAIAEGLRPALPYQPAVVLFVLAVRLFDLGQHDEGLYWFYQAQYRARLLHRVLDSEQIGQMFDPAFELESAHGAFMELAGPYFNGYAGCSQARWLGVIARVQADNQTAPDFSLIYPDLALRPAAEWPVLNQQVNEGLSQLAEALREGWDEMQAQRRANGTHERFCTE